MRASGTSCLYFQVGQQKDAVCFLFSGGNVFSCRIHSPPVTCMCCVQNLEQARYRCAVKEHGVQAFSVQLCAVLRCAVLCFFGTSCDPVGPTLIGTEKE
eukprot:m.303861 g.303861  ORF g.303861 m.303861 type:complete len:99 (-) comp23009_c0_seq7:64-360(-)